LIPWGITIARLLNGGSHLQSRDTGDAARYWQQSYRLEAVAAARKLAAATMTDEVFGAIRVPVFLGYCDRNEEEQDRTATVTRMLALFERLGTPPGRKRRVAFPGAGTHLIASSLVSRDHRGVARETFAFAEEILGMRPLRPDTPETH
jgi:hypothetical protein